VINCIARHVPKQFEGIPTLTPPEIPSSFATS